jgi:hypothetical protein
MGSKSPSARRRARDELVTIPEDSMRDEVALAEWHALRDVVSWARFPARVGLTLKQWDGIYQRAEAAGDKRAVGRPANPWQQDDEDQRPGYVRTGSLRLPGMGDGRVA